MTTKTRWYGFRPRCRYCEIPVFPIGSKEVRANPDCQATRDHVVPKSMKFMPENSRTVIAVACMACNQIKMDHPAEIFEAWVKENKTGDKAERRIRFKAFIAALTITGWEVAREMAIQERKRSQVPTAPPQDIAEVVRRFMA